LTRRRPRSCTAPIGRSVAVAAALLSAHCSGNHASESAAGDAAAGRDGSTEAAASDAAADAGSDSGSSDTGALTDSGNDTGTPVDGGSTLDAADAADAAPGVNADVCGVTKGTLAWVASVPAMSPTLVLSDVAASATDDAIVADQSGATYEQHRWDNAGAVVSVHQDALGQYVGRLWTSSLIVDTHDNLFYGTLMTGLTQGQNSMAQLSFTLLPPTGSAIVSPPIDAMMPTSSGPPTVLLFSTGFDSSGGYHGPLSLAAPQYFPAGVYCYGSNISGEATSAQSVTSTLVAEDFEWPAQNGSLYLTKSVTSSVNLGCGSLSVPTSGGIVLASLDAGGSCLWNKLLALPTAAVKATNFRVGADGTLALAVVYTGTIDFGGGPLVSTGTSSLAIGRFGPTGTLLYAKTFGSATASFTIGSLAINAAGTMVLTSGYQGSVDLGGGSLPASANTVLAVFDATGSFRWNTTVTVDPAGKLIAAAGTCGMVVATNSPSVDLGRGPLSVSTPPMAPTIGVAALGL
jgi:hypothetical protein